MLTLWLDAHLTGDVAPWIGSRFNVSLKSLREVGLSDADDEIVFAAARRFNVDAIITKDADFMDLLDRLGRPPSIVLLTFGNTSNFELRSKLIENFADVIRMIQEGVGLIEID